MRTEVAAEEFDELPEEGMAAVNEVCDRFERRWREGSGPPIERMLEGVSDSWRPVLLRELIALDIEYRRLNNLPADPQVYLEQFPSLSRSLMQQIASHERHTATADGSETAESPTASADLACPTAFGDYEVLSKIAHGGMGVVYRAKQTSLDRLVALKMMRLADDDPRWLQRFQLEAEAAARLDHQNIVPIYDLGRHEGRPFLTMKLIDGGSLADVIRDQAGKPRDKSHFRDAADLTAKVADAIHHAHQHGILHRDLKPANILIDRRGQPLVTDFGLAKRLHQVEDVLTESRALLGTPCYMAPEQVRGAQLTVETDVYALGAMLYELLTGSRPFEGGGQLDIARRVTDSQPTRPQALAPEIPKDLETICLKCLRKAPDRRYGSAKDLADDLRRYLAGRAITARPVSAWERCVRWCRRHPAIAALAAALLIVIVVALTLIAWKWRESDWHASNFHDSVLDARTITYVGRIAGAQHLVDEGDYPRASEMLGSTSPDLHSFEHRYLAARVHRGMRILAPLSAAAVCVAVSPDESLVAAGGQDGTVRVWDADSGSLWHELDAGHDAVLWTRFFADSRRLCFIHGPTVSVWDLDYAQTGPVTAIQVDGFRITAAALAQDGERIALGGEHGELSWWSLTGEQLSDLPNCDGSVRSLALDPPARRLAVASRHKPFAGDAGVSLALYDVATQQVDRRLPAHADFGRSDARAVSFDASGNWLYSAGGGSAHVWDMQDEAADPLTFPHPGGVWSLAASGRGRIATSGRDGIQLRNRNGPLHAEFRGHAARQVALPRSSSFVATAGEDGSVRIWRLESGFLAEFRQVGRQCSCIDASLSGELVVYAFRERGSLKSNVPGGSAPPRLVAFDRTTRRRHAVTYSPQGVVSALAVSPDRQRVAVADETGLHLVGPPRRRQLQGEDEARDVVERLAWSASGSHLVVADTRGLVEVWHAEPGERALRWQAPAAVLGAALDRHGRRLALALADGSTRIIDVASGAQRWSASGDAAQRGAVALHPDATWLASAHDGRVRLWTVREKRLAFDKRDNSRVYRTLAITADGRRLAGADQGRDVVLWDTATGRRVLHLPWRAQRTNRRISGLTSSPRSVWKMTFQRGDGSLQLIADNQPVWYPGAPLVTLQITCMEAFDQRCELVEN